MNRTKKSEVQGEFRQWLRTELEERRCRNAKYSLRAFSRDLNLAPSTLSEVLNGRHVLSPERALGVVKALGWNKEREEIVRAHLVRRKGAAEKALPSAVAYLLDDQRLAELRECLDRIAGQVEEPVHCLTIQVLPLAERTVRTQSSVTD